MSSVTMPMPLEMKMMEDTAVILALKRFFWGIRDVRHCDLLAESVVCLSEDNVMQAIEQACITGMQVS